MLPCCTLLMILKEMVPLKGEAYKCFASSGQSYDHWWGGRLAFFLKPTDDQLRHFHCHCHIFKVELVDPKWQDKSKNFKYFLFCISISCHSCWCGDLMQSPLRRSPEWHHRLRTSWILFLLFLYHISGVAHRTTRTSVELKTFIKPLSCLKQCLPVCFSAISWFWFWCRSSDWLVQQLLAHLELLLWISPSRDE